jgi:hypothetical protein
MVLGLYYMTKLKSSTKQVKVIWVWNSKKHGCWIIQAFCN